MPWQITAGGVFSALVVVCFTFAFASLVSGQTTIYQDDFDGTGPLHGTFPEVGASTWAEGDSTSNQDFGADGVVTASSSGVWLPIAPSPGNVYTASAAIDATSGGGNWIILGFAQSNVDVRTINKAGNTTMWICDDKTVTNGGEYWAGRWKPGTVAFPSQITDTAHNLEIVLDATDADAANWTAQFSLDGTVLNAVPVLAGNGSYGDITNVGFSTTNAGGTIGNFKLETVVPEPASVMLIAFGALLLGAGRRRS